MLNSNYNGTPGPGATTTQSFLEVLASLDLQAKIPGGVLLATGFGVVKKGRVLGKITASGKFAPYTSTTLTAGFAIGATALTVADASAFVVGDNITIGTDAAKAVTAINYATNTITIGAGLVAAQTSGAAVQTNDGRQNAVCILDNDQDTTNSDVSASAWISGIFTKANCYGVDSSAQTALKLCYFA